MPPAPVILVTGVSGSGKSTFGSRLARRLGVRFVDGDDLHPAANVDKMASGRPLDDADRRPWLGAVRREIEGALTRNEGLVVACSALKRTYRDILARQGESVVVVHLDGPMELIAERMRARSDHFMPPGLLESQFRDLEPPDRAMVLDVRRPIDDLVEDVIELLRRGPS